MNFRSENLNEFPVSDFTWDKDADVIKFKNGATLCSVVKAMDGYWSVVGFAPALWTEWALIGVGLRLREMNHDWHQGIVKQLEQKGETK